MGLREEILAKTALPIEPVPVPEWGMTLRVRTMPVTEKTEFELTCYARNGRNQDDALRVVKEKLVARTVVDDDGNRVFTDDDADGIGRLHPIAVDRLFRVAQRLNLEVGDVEELAKNSAGTQS